MENPLPSQSLESLPLMHHNTRGTMAKSKVHRIHRGNDSWIKDIKVLTCILRLRCQPSVAYVNIAEYLLAVWPVAMLRLAGRKYSAARDIPADLDAMKELKEEYTNVFLPRLFETCENEEADAWKLAREWEDATVYQILKHTGLGDLGYNVCDKGEMELQILWGKTEDWRAGSIPEPRGTTNKNHGAHTGRSKEHDDTAGSTSLLSVPETSLIRRMSIEAGKATIQLLRLGPHANPNNKKGTKKTNDSTHNAFANQVAEIQTISNSLDDTATKQA